MNVFLEVLYRIIVKNRKKILIRIYHQLSSFVPWECLNRHWQLFYGSSPVVSIMGSPRCLWYCYIQDGIVFIYAVYQVFFASSSLTYPMHFSMQCYLRVSAVLHSYTMPEVFQALMPSCSLLLSVDGDRS